MTKESTFILLIDPLGEKCNQKYSTYLIPDSVISNEDRIILNEIQRLGQFDETIYAKPSPDFVARRDALVLYFYEPKIGADDDHFIKVRKENYEKLFNVEFDLLSCWVKYKRETNWNTKQNISHVYEIVNNTFEEC